MIDSALRLLRIMPEMAPVYAGRIRRLVLQNRRTGIFYATEERGLVVLVVCSLSQDRNTILKHLGLNVD